MSDSVQNRKLARLNGMSCLPPGTDIGDSGCDVRFGPKADVNRSKPLHQWARAWAQGPTTDLQAAEDFSELLSTDNVGNGSQADIQRRPAPGHPA
jgi:hypothetical protein